jgi:hypothetical protein
MKTSFIVEVEKSLDWENGFLNYEGKVVSNISEAHNFETEEDAEDAADSFNREFGRNGRILARVL